jgi:hypothetical protein
MSTIELVEQLKQLSNAERLIVIEAATQLIRNDMSSRQDRARRIEKAAKDAQSLYEPGGELFEWTSLDSEDFLDEHVSG